MLGVARVQVVLRQQRHNQMMIKQEMLVVQVLPEEQAAEAAVALVLEVLTQLVITVVQKAVQVLLVHLFLVDQAAEVLLI